jgi:hypothetical protein
MVLVQVASQNYPANTRQFETPNPIDPALARMRITVTRENWPGADGEIIGSIALEVALDGVTYPPISGASTALLGGATVGRNGAAIPTQYVECDLPGVGMATRKVRATFVNTQNLRTAVTVEGF